MNASRLVPIAIGVALLLQGTALAGGLVRAPDRSFRVCVRSWKELREQNIVMQRHDYSCGAACLATLIKYYWGDPVTEEEFIKDVLSTLNKEEIENAEKSGLSMTDLRLCAVRKGYLASLGSRDMSDMYTLKVPVIVRIVHDGYNHFVVFRGILEDRVYLADPMRGNIRMTVTQFMREWNDGKAKGGTVLVVAKKDVTSLPENSPLLVRSNPCLPERHELQTARRILFLADQPPFPQPGRDRP